MAIFGYVSIIISVIGIIWALIILWQYITGRDYWSEAADSMVVPSAIVSIVPGLNMAYWTIMLIIFVGACSMGALLTMRENAVERRNNAKTKS